MHKQMNQIIELNNNPHTHGHVHTVILHSSEEDLIVTYSSILNAFHHQVPTREFRTGGAKQSDAYTLEEDRWNDPDKSLELFFEEYPVLQLVGTPKRIHSNM